MTRNRAILADIVEFGLDPTTAHKNTHANGRLAKKASESNEQKNVEIQQAQQEIVELSNEPEQQEIVDQNTVEETEEMAQIEESEKVVEASNKKKSKKSI